MKERGNILFLILLAIILFAALTYAVNSNFRVSQDQNIPKEKARAIAAEIINYTALLEQTVTRMRVVGGCRADQFNFNNTLTSTYQNPSPPADKHCDVFDPAGGGMAWKPVNTEWLIPQAEANALFYSGTFYATWHLPWNQCLQQVGGGGCSDPVNDNELMTGIRYLKKDICDAINAQLGETTAASPENCTALGDTSGTFRAGFANTAYSGCASQIGKRIYCANTNRTGYTFYHVLWAR